MPTPRRQAGLADEDDAAEEERSIGEGEGAEGGDDRHLPDAETHAAIGPVAHHPGGDDRDADIVAERVGDEGDDGNDAPGQALSDMEEGNPVVPGEGGIGEQRREHAEEEDERAPRHDRRPDIGDMDAVQFLRQEVDGEHNGGEADEGPDIFELALHEAAGLAVGGLFPEGDLRINTAIVTKTRRSRDSCAPMRDRAAWRLRTRAGAVKNRASRRAP
jgi:hypothetical protein